MRIATPSRLRVWICGGLLLVLGCLLAWPARAALLPAADEDPAVFWHVVIVFGALLASGAVHELVHAGSFLCCAGVTRRDLRFGWRPGELQLTTHLSAPVSLRGFRVSMLLPAALVGLLPIGVGVALSLGVLALVGIANLTACGGDMAAALATLGLEAPTRIAMVAEGHFQLLPGAPPPTA